MLQDVVGRVGSVRGGVRRWSLALRPGLVGRTNGSRVRMHVERGVRVGQGVVVEVRPRTRTTVVIRAGASIGDGVRFVLAGGEVRIGPGVELHDGVILNLDGGRFECDGPTVLSPGVVVHCAEHLRVDAGVRVGERSTLVDSAHVHTDPDTWSYHTTRTRPVAIARGATIGARCTVASGTRVGAGAEVAPGSVVVDDVPDGAVVSGVPARVVGATGRPVLDDAVS